MSSAGTQRHEAVEEGFEAFRSKSLRFMGIAEELIDRFVLFWASFSNCMTEHSCFCLMQSLVVAMKALLVRGGGMVESVETPAFQARTAHMSLHHVMAQLQQPCPDSCQVRHEEPQGFTSESRLFNTC